MNYGINLRESQSFSLDNKKLFGIVERLEAIAEKLSPTPNEKIDKMQTYLDEVVGDNGGICKELSEHEIRIHNLEAALEKRGPGPSGLPPGAELPGIGATTGKPADKRPEDGHSEYERPGSFFLECQAPDGDNDRKETIECSHGFNLKFYNQSVQSMQGKVAFYEWAMKFCAAFRAWLAAARKGGQ